MTSHEIPTHLGVADRAFYGLSVRQVLYLTGGCSVGYQLWSQWGDTLPALRLALAISGALITLTFALARPFGRGVEEWALVIARYLLIPHRAVWRPAAPSRAAGAESTQRWIAHAPRPRTEASCD